MSHHIYTTPGFIVHSTPYGEAGKFLLIFTRDLGMVGAVAQGIRLSQSKLRYHTQDYSYSLFSLVRGKEVWRVTGANEIDEACEVDIENQKLYVRILSLLKRLLSGEEKNEKLFEVMKSMRMHLVSHSNDLESVEYLTVLRILDCLGYISSHEVYKDLLSDTKIDEQVLQRVIQNKMRIIQEINNGLKESQL